jgi:hypothetical protein
MQAWCINNFAAGGESPARKLQCMSAASTCTGPCVAAVKAMLHLGPGGPLSQARPAQPCAQGGGRPPRAAAAPLGSNGGGWGDARPSPARHWSFQAVAAPQSSPRSPRQSRIRPPPRSRRGRHTCASAAPFASGRAGRTASPPATHGVDRAASARLSRPAADLHEAVARPADVEVPRADVPARAMRTPQGLFLEPKEYFS